MTKLINFYRLPKERKVLICKVLIWLIWFRCCLWILPFRIARKLLPYENLEGNTNINIDRSLIRSVVGLVERLSRCVPYATCLTQALATKKILRSLGQESDLVFGVNINEQAKFQAHAWIEINHHIIIGRQSGHNRFAVLSSKKSFTV